MECGVNSCPITVRPISNGDWKSKKTLAMRGNDTSAFYAIYIFLNYFITNVMLPMCPWFHIRKCNFINKRPDFLVFNERNWINICPWFLPVAFFLFSFTKCAVTRHICFKWACHGPVLFLFFVLFFYCASLLTALQVKVDWFCARPRLLAESPGDCCQSLFSNQILIVFKSYDTDWLIINDITC